MSTELDASEVGRQLIDAIHKAGQRLGLEVVREYPVQGGRIDIVWLWRSDEPFLDELGPFVLAAFEVESSCRTRKHVKGDYLNLLDAGAALGVIVLAGDGEDVESLRRFAKQLVARPGARVEIWSQVEVEALRDARSYTAPVAAPEALDQRSEHPVVDHQGKYRALWAWLRLQKVRQLTLTFREIEEVIGGPLPPSCREYPVHWYSYEGSAVARAIIEAGWRATRVDLLGERVTFVQRDNHDQ